MDFEKVSLLFICFCFFLIQSLLYWTRVFIRRGYQWWGVWYSKLNWGFSLHAVFVSWPGVAVMLFLCIVIALPFYIWRLPCPHWASVFWGSLVMESVQILCEVSYLRVGDTLMWTLERYQLCLCGCFCDSQSVDDILEKSVWHQSW